MNRVMRRARALLILVLVLAIGLSLFVGEYFARAGDWIMFPGSPHVYNAGNIGCGVIADVDGKLLLDLSNGRSYSANPLLNKAMIHWLGDRQGSISAPALSHYASLIAGFDPVGGLYDYGNDGGQVRLTLSAEAQLAALEAMGDYVGTVAVYNYKTGQLLCAVTTPNFDPNAVADIAGDTTGQFEGIYLNRCSQSA